MNRDSATIGQKHSEPAKMDVKHQSETKSFESKTHQTVESMATLDRLMESTAELDKFISSNVVDTSVNIHDKRSEALEIAMMANIDQMQVEEKDVEKCRREFEVKYQMISKKLHLKIQSLQDHLNSREVETQALKKDHKTLTEALNFQNSKFDSVVKDSQLAKEAIQKELCENYLQLKSLQEQRNTLKCKILIADQDLTEKQQISDFKTNTDLTKFSLLREQEAIRDQLNFLKTQKEKVQNESKANEERLKMLLEDEFQSEQIKIKLVYQMEEFEQHVSQFTSNDVITYQER